MPILLRSMPTFLLLLLLPWEACAAETSTLNMASTSWILTATALVLFMTLPGLALFYGGLVRSKNVLSLLMQCFAISCLVSVLWLLYGYSLAFNDGGAMQQWLGNFDKVLFLGMNDQSLVMDIPESVYLMFQMTFAIITPALVIGGFAERVRFSAVLWFTVAWLTLVYIPVCHWIWGGGFLMQMGVKDFAGGLVVHLNAGMASLVAALLIGKRHGFPHTLIMPHNLTMSFTGAGMLWVGWYGFNAGSALAANGNAGMAMLVTHMGAASGALAWMGMEWVRHGKPSVLGIITGMVAGLGMVTPSAGYVSPLGGTIIGLLAGIICYIATLTLKQKLKIDDSLDVFPVHGVGGLIGPLLTAFFVAPALGGSGFSAGLDLWGQVKVQLLAIVVVAVWSALVSWLIFKLVDHFIGLRVPKEEETEGLDLSFHDERGYNIDAGNHW